MVIEQILLKQFRHFKHTLFSFSPCSNLVVGPNGSGKTSVLESIYYLAYSKSFRSNINRHIIAYHQEHFQVDAKIQYNLQPLTLHTVYSNHKPLNTLLLNQDKNVKQSEIAKMLPVVFIDTSTHREFASSPSNRRDFLNWCCFYTDADYHSNLSKYKRALQQRNHLLKQKNGQASSLLSTWTEPLIFYAEKIHNSRVLMIEQLNDHMSKIWPYFFSGPCALIDYQQGWKKGIEYTDSLAQSLHQDSLYGYTQVGPHRADLSCLTPQKHPLFQSLSQGQQKLFAYIMKFIQLHLITRLNQQRGILLIDDIPAALDAANQTKIIEFIQTIDCQKFLTALDPSHFQSVYTDHAIFVDQIPLTCDPHSPHKIQASPIL